MLSGRLSSSKLFFHLFFAEIEQGRFYPCARSVGKNIVKFWTKANVGMFSITFAYGTQAMDL